MLALQPGSSVRVAICRVELVRFSLWSGSASSDSGAGPGGPVRFDWCVASVRGSWFEHVRGSVGSFVEKADFFRG